MYINRTTNELVQAIWEEDVNGKDYSCWFVYKDGRKIAELNVADFQSLYGEAMVNNPMIPADDKPHIKDKFCDNLGCIPYIPKQRQADEEPVFPICGTCNARKEQDLTKGELKFYNTKPDSLMLSDEEICQSICGIPMGDNPCKHKCARYMDKYNAMVAELDHLAKLGIVYIRVKHCVNSHWGEYVENRDIPLSDYMKGEK